MQAKQLAQQKAEELIEKKLKACREAYQEEFEYLAITFEELKVEVDQLKQKESNYRQIINE